MITPCLIFNQNAEAAIEFYISIFENSKVEKLIKYGSSDNPKIQGKIKRAEIVLNGQRLLCRDLSTVQNSKSIPALTFFVECYTESDLKNKFKSLSENGKVISPLTNSSYGNLSGSVQDKFGLSWQLNFTKNSEESPDINVCFANSKEVRPEYKI